MAKDTTRNTFNLTNETAVLNKPISKSVDYEKLKNLKCPIKDDDLFYRPISEARHMVEEWLNTVGAPFADNDEKARAMIQAALRKTQLYMFCLGVFEAKTANMGIRIGKEEDGDDIKKMEFRFAPGRAIYANVARRANGTSGQSGILNLEMHMTITGDELSGIPLKNLSVRFAENSHRKIPSDFISGACAGLDTDDKADFVKLCKDQAFHNAYANASNASRIRIISIARRVLIEAALRHKDYQDTGSDRMGAYWLVPPINWEYQRVMELQKQLDAAKEALSMTEGRIA